LTKSVLKGLSLVECWESDIENWFPGMLPNALQRLTKVCHCPGKYFEGNVA
jgi:hypothetical protein